MNPLHKAPGFLMELFRLRTTGRQPDEFATTVQPVVDVHAMYSADMLLSGLNTTVGAMNLIVRTTEFGRATRLVGVAGRILLGANAGTRLALTIGMYAPTLGSGQFFPFFSSGAGAGGTPFVGMEVWVGGKLPGGTFVLPPGAVVELRVHSNATGSDHSGQICLLFESALAG